MSQNRGKPKRSGFASDGGGGGDRFAGNNNNRYPRNNDNRQRSFDASPVEFPESQQYPIRRSLSPKVDQKNSLNLVGNYYKLDITEKEIYHYNVQISQPPSINQTQKNDSRSEQNREKFLRNNSREILKEFLSKNPTLFQDIPFIYNGWENLYTTKKIQLDNDYVNEFEYRVGNGKPDRSVPKTNVEIVFKEKINLKIIEDFYNGKVNEIPNKIIDILNKLFAKILMEYYTVRGQCYFDMNQPRSVRELSFIEFVYGFELSTRMAQIGICLVIQPRVECLISSKCKTLMDLINEYDYKSGENITNFEKINFKKINSFIKNLSIYTEHGNQKRSYKIKELIAIRLNEMKLGDDDDNMTILDYFNKNYPEVKINPKLPMVQMTKPHVYMPLDLCYIDEKQFVDNTKNYPNIHKVFMKECALKPESFFNKIQSYVDHIGKIGSTILGEFGVNLQNKLVKFNGYQLDKPRMVVRNPRAITKSASIVPWAFISFDEKISNGIIDDFIDGLLNEAEKMNSNLPMGLKYSDFKRIKNLNDIENVLKKLKTECKIEFCFVVVPEHHNYLTPSDIYNAASSIGCKDLGLKIQCLNGFRVANVPGGYFNNLLFEVNGNLGGQNTVVEPRYFQQQIGAKIQLNETMIIGIDVNHPGFFECSQNFRVSIAAAVGTTNVEMTDFGNCFRIQKRERTMEIIEQLAEMIKELLEKYKMTNGKYPKNLIIFRDGVSESQFDQVKMIELQDIRRLIEQTKLKIRFTLIIVQKRHHTRFVKTMPTSSDANQKGPPTRNVPCGTVVDNSICEPNFTVAYVNSHFSRLGTSKPTKYIVIENQLQFTNSELHKLAYLVCYNSVRFSSPLSIPTPIKYADLCAYKCKIHLLHELKKNPIQSTDEWNVEHLQQMITFHDPKAQDSFFYL
uniref:Argonaute 7 n=1 Tax=Dermatophagoides farinae TaxID=6954 RepID=A0A2I6AXD5_DERFA|nr:argonaute 7 [Dermatophagoides farinae]